MPKAVIALGSNLGDRLAYLRTAVNALSELANSQVLAVSNAYSNRAIGPQAPDYLNAVVLLHTELPPADLLAQMHRIEAENQRERESHWSPRTLDLDLVDYAGFVSQTPELRVPHPLAASRDFVVLPLAEVAPAWPLAVDARLLDAETLAGELKTEAMEIAHSGEWWK